MRRFALPSFVLTLAALPLGVQALYQSPGMLLQKLQYTEFPRSGSVELHAEADGDTYLSAWIATEDTGKTDTEYQLQGRATIDLVEQSEYIRVRTEFRVVDGVAYGRITEATGENVSDTTLEDIQNETNRWYALSISSSDQGSSMDDLRAALRKEGIDVNEQELQDLLQEILDSLMMMRTRSGSNPVYIITLKNHFLKDLISTLNTWIVRLENRNPGLDLGGYSAQELSAELDAAEAEFAAIEETIHDALSLSIRIFTDESDAITGSDMALEFSYEDLKLNLKGSMKKSATPVIVSAPAGAIYLETEQFMQSEQEDWNHQPPMTEERSIESPLPSPSIRNTSRTSSWNTVTPTSETCTAEPGSPEYVLQMRKGACPQPATSSRR